MTKLTTKTGTVISFSANLDSRISSVYQASGGQAVSIIAASEKDAKSLMSEYRAHGLQTSYVGNKTFAVSA